MLLILFSLFFIQGFGEKQKGLNFLNGQWSLPKYDSSDAQKSLTLLRKSGTDFLALTFCWFQWNIFSTTIYPRVGISPTEQELTSIIQFAHKNGVKIMVRPLVDPDWSNPKTKGTWRGLIGATFTEAQWEQWFRSYSEYILKFAKLAAQLNAEEFSIGGELIDASHQSKHWRALIPLIRSVYKGPILYGANHGNENAIDWWDAVDYIAIDAYYFLLPGNPNPSFKELLDAWDPILFNLESLSLRYNKSVIFSEIGFCSKTGANMNPAGCDGNQLNLTAQAALYESVYQTFWNKNWFEGIFWWAWISNPNDGGLSDQGFTPSGKPAESVMLKWNRK